MHATGSEARQARTRGERSHSRLHGRARRRRCFDVDTTSQARERNFKVFVEQTLDTQHTINATLRRRYMALEQQAADTDDERTLNRIGRKMQSIGAEFVQLNLGLVGTVCKRYTHGANPSHTTDFNLAGHEALWRSFCYWDPDKATFGTWSRPHIVGALRREANFHERPHRRYHDDLLARRARLELELIERSGAEPPTEEELADILEVSVDKLRDAQRAPYLSLDAPVGDGGDTLADIVGDTTSDFAARDDTQPAVLSRAALDRLSGDNEERYVKKLAQLTMNLDPLELYVVLVYGGLHGWTSENLPQIADTLGIGREVIRRRYQSGAKRVQAVLETSVADELAFVR